MKMQPGILFSLVTLALLAGCNSPQKLQQRAPAMPVPSVSVSRNVQPVSPDIYAQPAPEVVRYDRYLLVSTAPQAAQRDPLSQVIDIRIPASLKPTCVFRSIRSRIGIEVRSAIRIHSINRELNFFYRFLTRFFAAFHYRGIFPQ